jgi:hypothetical protein
MTVSAQLEWLDGVMVIVPDKFLSEQEGDEIERLFTEGRIILAPAGSTVRLPRGEADEPGGVPGGHDMAPELA